MNYNITKILEADNDNFEPIVESISLVDNLLIVGGEYYLERVKAFMGRDEDDIEYVSGMVVRYWDWNKTDKDFSALIYSLNGDFGPTF